jgi:deoxyinosine 3'endonuclease (endonuclease V)
MENKKRSGVAKAVLRGSRMNNISYGIYKYRIHAKEASADEKLIRSAANPFTTKRKDRMRLASIANKLYYSTWYNKSMKSAVRAADKRSNVL